MCHWCAHLVGEVAVGDVAVGQHGRVHQRAVRNAHAVVQLNTCRGKATPLRHNNPKMLPMGAPPLGRTAQ